MGVDWDARKPQSILLSPEIFGEDKDRKIFLWSIIFFEEQLSADWEKVHYVLVNCLLSGLPRNSVVSRFGYMDA